jgi:acetoin utilization deacetylase AcuC-like enzyme
VAKEHGDGVLTVGGLGGRDTHDTGRWHPERGARLEAAGLGIADALPGDAVVTLDARAATPDELGRVHSRSYVESLAELCRAGGGELDPDTPVSPGSWETARLAAGAGLAVVDALAESANGPGFVCVRPPGHHARVGRGMGFCLFNNVAVTAAALLDQGARVLIVDWDVHHGNGTQEIFWDEPRVVYVSTHQSPLFPGTGRVGECGGPNAPGTTVNFPFPEGATGDALYRALDDVVAGVVERFAPTWVLVSAGFDAHRDDPLAGLMLSSADFAGLAQRVLAFAPDASRLVLFLEGGYDLPALRRSVAATVSTLVGAPVVSESPTAGGPGIDTVQAVREVRRRLELDA